MILIAKETRRSSCGTTEVDETKRKRKKAKHDGEEQQCVMCKYNWKKPDRMTKCSACNEGPMCYSCMGNDIEHGVEKHPICVKCVDTTHWCTDCDDFIALPSEDPLIEGFLCEGYSDVKCDVLICYWCSYGDYYFDGSEDEEPPERRQCEKCREKSTIVDI